MINNNVNATSITLNLARYHTEEHINNNVIDNIKDISNNEYEKDISGINNIINTINIEDTNIIKGVTNIENENNIKAQKHIDRNYFNNNEIMRNIIENKSNNKLGNDTITIHKYKHIITYSDGHGHNKKLYINDFNNNRLINNYRNINYNTIPNYSDSSKNITPSCQVILNNNKHNSDDITFNNNLLLNNQCLFKNDINICIGSCSSIFNKNKIDSYYLNIDKNKINSSEFFNSPHFNNDTFNISCIKINKNTLKLPSLESNTNSLNFGKVDLNNKLLESNNLDYFNNNLKSSNLYFSQNNRKFNKLDSLKNNIESSGLEHNNTLRFSGTDFIKNNYNIIKNTPSICNKILEKFNNNFTIESVKSYPIVNGNCILDDNTVLNLQDDIGLPINASSVGILLDKMLISSEIKKLSIVNNNSLNPVVFINYKSNDLANVNINCHSIPYLKLNNIENNSDTCRIKGIKSKRYTILDSNKTLVINNKVYSKKPLVIMNNKIKYYKDVYWNFI